MKRIFQCFVVFCIAAIGVPAAALGQNAAAGTIAKPAAAPVRVQTCAINRKWAKFDIGFSNVSDGSISRVTFAVMSASGPVFMTYHDGPFAPGTQTTRGNTVGDSILNFEAAYTCVPVAVSFADGSNWANPSTGATMEATLPQTPGSNIALSSCYAAVGDADIEVHSDFRNTAPQAAVAVDLGLVENGVLVAVEHAKGTYSPGTLINYTYHPAHGAITSDLMHQRCVVLGVTYADGTQWKNASPPAAADWPSIGTSDEKAPVSIDSCSVDGPSEDGRYWHLGYRNDGTQPLTIVDFALVSDGLVIGSGRELHDLSPGEQLGGRQYWSGAPGKISDPQCIPIRVQYADGSTWVNPALH